MVHSASTRGISHRCVPQDRAAGGVAVCLLTSRLDAALHRAVAPGFPPDLQTHDLANRARSSMPCSSAIRPCVSNWATSCTGQGTRQPRPRIRSRPPRPCPSPSRSWLALVGAGTLLAWRDRHPDPREALHRLCSPLLLQVGRFSSCPDLHHLAGDPHLAIAGLSGRPRRAALPPRVRPHGRPSSRLFPGWSQARSLGRTDAVVPDGPHVHPGGTIRAADTPRESGAERVVVADYETRRVRDTWSRLPSSMRPLVARERGARPARFSDTHPAATCSYPRRLPHGLQPAHESGSAGERRRSGGTGSPAGRGATR